MANVPLHRHEHAYEKPANEIFMLCCLRINDSAFNTTLAEIKEITPVSHTNDIKKCLRAQMCSGMNDIELDWRYPFTATLIKTCRRKEPVSY
ncbi:hypothetical protein O9992_24120 [Vibrio lentus]|nr:hypothetical protein [Vibrio lentus]